MEKRVCLTDEPERYFYPHECKIYRQGRFRTVPWIEELYVTKTGTCIMHVLFSDGFQKWYEVSQQEAQFWLYRNGIKTFEIEL